MKIITIYEKLEDELLLILKLFYSLEEINSLNYTFVHSYKEIQNKRINTIEVIANKRLINERIDDLNSTNNTELLNKRYLRRYAKLCFYEALFKLTRKKLPWGSLTGIRPTKVFYELMGENNNNAVIARKLIRKNFYVSKTKAEILYQTVLNQTIVKDNMLIDYYVNIPFCTSKCSYCSFISSSLNECGHLVAPYITALLKEMNAVNKIISKEKYVVRSIYIGGGTPTSIKIDELENILKLLNFPVSEFTVEAGRPDTITKEKLDLLKKYGVTRISINPQTFHDETLKSIGRNHTANDIINTYHQALPYKFIINMDLIAGLEKENFKIYKQSLKKAILLNPQNITVHTLSIKRTSSLQQCGGNKGNVKEVKHMINYSYKKLKKHGYLPYYLYKQKYMIGNLENIGYAKDKCVSIFNIDSMEETLSIVACGANAISKKFEKQFNTLERLPNLRNVMEYTNRVDEMIERKEKLFGNKKKKTNKRFTNYV